MTHSALRDEDGSVNFVWDLGDKQALEARYVVRDHEELICYLSSQTACGRACRMCHLTRTGQVHPTNTTLDEFLMQARPVFQEAGSTPNSFKTVSFNFMARGEPLDNPAVYNTLLEKLSAMALERGLLPRFKISTIMPEGAKLNLMERFPVIYPDIYYSLYSVRPEFRSKWFPKAAPVSRGLSALYLWQQHSHKIPKIHLAAIKGQNDSVEDLQDLCEVIRRSEVRVDFNIVRYNPYDDLSEEGDWRRVSEILGKNFPDSKIQLIPRVGFNVKASCGMFIS